MIRHENNRGFFASQMEQRAEHHVVEAVATFDHAAVDFKVLFLDPRLPRRVVLHETMAKVVDPVVVDRHEVPRLELHQRRGSSMDAHGVRKGLGKTDETFIFFLVDFRKFRNERTDMFRIEFEGVETKFLEALRQTGRVHRSGGHLPLVGFPAHRVGAWLSDFGIDVRILDISRRLVEVANHHAVDRFGRMRWPPTHDVALLANLVQHVPDRLGLTIDVGDRTNALSVGSRLAESMNTVLVRTFPRAH